jgi:hypothetical protein
VLQVYEPVANPFEISEVDDDELTMLTILMEPRCRSLLWGGSRYEQRQNAAGND